MTNLEKFIKDAEAVLKKSMSTHVADLLLLAKAIKADLEAMKSTPPKQGKE